MSTFVVSDLHLMDRVEPFLFNREKEKAFTQLCRALSAKDKLILAGDIFDLTGMTPCKIGQEQFFNFVVPEDRQDKALIKSCSEIRTTEDLLMATKKIFPAFFSCLTALALNKQLIFIPGNHDCAFLQTCGKEVFCQAIGAGQNDVQWADEIFIEDELIVIHGNQFDRANRTDRGCKNSGFIFTSALYNAVLPALSMLGVQSILLDALPAVRPEEESVIGIQHYLNNTDCKRVLLGFAQLLQRNGFFFGRAAIPSWFLTHSFPFLSNIIRDKITADRVRAILPKEDDIIKDARAGATTLQQKMRRRNPALANSVIVVGHTHERDLTENYINLGTWLDHIDGLSPACINNADTSLPVFVQKDNGESTLYNIHSISPTRTLWECPVLWTKPAKKFTLHQ